jgi:chromosomal replication initiation ATPase DnaA
VISDDPDQYSAAGQPMFGFPAPVARWGDLLHGSHNAAALRIAAQPSGWATPVLCITGPVACGLSFLAEAWAEKFEGEALRPEQLGKSGRKGIDALAARHVAVDDADIAAQKHAEALLSLINLVGAGGGRLLLTAHRPPSQWRTGSADLKSRLNALPAGEIGPPDEDILRARLEIAAERRYLRLGPETLTYLVPRLELAYEAVEGFMGRLSRAVSDHDRAPSLPLARRVLEAMAGAEDEDGAKG